MPAQKLGLAEAVLAFEYLLLDTCVLIDEFRNVAQAVPVLTAIPRPQRRISVLALWEFLHGAQGAVVAVGLRIRREDWREKYGIVAVDLFESTSKTFRSLLDARGCPPGAVDCLLAAEAVARRWPFVTRNVRDFEHVSGLRLVPV